MRQVVDSYVDAQTPLDSTWAQYGSAELTIGPDPPTVTSNGSEIYFYIGLFSTKYCVIGAVHGQIAPMHLATENAIVGTTGHAEDESQQLTMAPTGKRLPKASLRSTDSRGRGHDGRLHPRATSTDVSRRGVPQTPQPTHYRADYNPL